MTRYELEKDMITNCRNVLSKARDVVVSVPWGKVRGIEIGPRDATPVLLIHGFLDNCYSFVPLLTKLPLNKRYIAIDLPGHGHSDHIENNYYTILNAIVQLEFIRLGIGCDKMSLVGHSLGAIISCLYTSTFPEHVDKTVMIDSVLPRTMGSNDVVTQLRTSITNHVQPHQPQTEYADKDELIERLASSTYYSSVPKEICGLILERGSIETDNGIIQRYDKSIRNTSLMYLTNDMIKEFARNWRTPLIYIEAEPGLKTMHITYNKAIREMKSVCSTSEHFTAVIVPGPHHVHITNSGKIADIINQFIG